MKRILRYVLPFLALAAIGTVFAQTPKRLTNPGFRLVDGATVYASARQPDGGTVLIGNFSSINGVQRWGIARLRADGSVDSSWGNLGYQHFPQGFNRPVVASDLSGAVYVAGLVISSGETHSGLMKLSASTGELVDDWHSSVGSFPFLSLAADATGVYVGKVGGFHKVSAETGAIQWSASCAPCTATSLTLDGRGSIYAVVADGDSPPRQFVARFSTSTGALDESWNPGLTLVDRWPQPLAVDACGSVYVAGRLAIGGGQARDRVVKLSAADGRFDPDWDPGDVVVVRAIATDAECSVYLGGRFEVIGGQARRNIVKLSHVDGHVVSDWAPEGACCGVRELATNAQGRITVAGDIRHVGAQTRLGFATLDIATGGAGSATDAESSALVTVIAADPDGGVVVGGNFAKAGSQPRHGLLRLRANGTLDTRWAPSLSSPREVTALAVQPAGVVYVGGHFEEVNLQARRYVARLTGADGALDQGWNPLPDAPVDAFAFAPDGSVYAGGSFSTIGGQVRANIAKLSARTGAVDSSWTPQTDRPVYVIATDGAGAVYAGGAFLQAGGREHWRLAKIDSASGNVFHDWSATASDPVSMLAISGADVYMASFGRPIQKLSSTTGAVDPAWNSDGDTRTTGFALTIDGSIYAATDEDLLKKYSADTGLEDPAWRISPISPPGGLTGPIAADTRGTVYVGIFDDIGAHSLAAYSADTVFFDPFDP